MKTSQCTESVVTPQYGCQSESCGAARANQFAHATRFRTCAGLLVAATLLAVSTGCVRRTLTITTEPPNALVYLNDLEVGRSKVTSDFLWYGDYSVVIRHDGYQTLDTHWNIKPPWYQLIPLDFVAEVLWPGQLHDQHERHFVLEPAVIPTTDQLLGRALETRDRALDTRR